MTRIAAIVAAVSFFACSGDTDKKEEEKKEHPSVAAVTQLADEMCACKDKACVDKVEVRFDKVTAEHKSAKGSAEQMQKAQKALGRYAECKTKILLK